MEEAPFISVVVPVLNRERDIGRCLESLLALDYPSFEIVVVDNGSTDGTQEVISRYPVRMVIEQKRGAYIARNTGLRMAAGEIIAFTDSDCIVEEDWLKTLVRNYIDQRVGGVGGHLLPFKASTAVEQFLGFGTLAIFHSSRKGTVRPDPHRFLSGALGSANMSYRLDVLKEVRGFDPDLAFFGGDYDLCWRVQRAGYKVIYDPEAIVYHKLRSTVFSLIEQFFSFGKYLPLLLKRQPGHFSYIKIKTYLLPSYEVRCRLPIQLLITLDFATLSLVAMIAVFMYPPLLYLSLPMLGLMALGTWRSSLEVLRKTNQQRWLILFPLLNLVRSYAFMVGRIVGGIKFRVVTL